MNGEKVPHAYSGDGNFIFISYSHQDSKQVLADIFELQSREIHIWYDEGLALGKTWNKEEVERHIQKDACVATVFYTSDSSLFSKAVWEEVEMVSRYEKEYCVVMVQPENGADVHEEYTAIRNRITRYFSDHLEDESGGQMSDETFDMLREVFNKNRTYTTTSKSSRFDELIKCFKAWNYYDQSDYFPLCNVLHNGHIEYFPSLLSVTPFEFTFFAVSHKRKHIANSLNEIPHQRVSWEQFSWGEFLGKDTFPDRKGLIVCIEKRDMTTICPILDKRRNAAPASPLLINIQTDEMDRAEELEQEAKRQLLQWKGRNEDLQPYEIDDFFLRQTELSSTRPFSPRLDELSELHHDEVWRVLVSDKNYGDMLFDLWNGNQGRLREKEWLFSQPQLGTASAYAHQREKLLSDPALLEVHDWNSFRYSFCPWENKDQI